MSRRGCERHSLSSATKRRLWSESGGYCANPECGAFLFDEDSAADFAEMAHIIAASIGGPRDVDPSQLPVNERADHSNVVVLCANCHTKIDKAPDRYPVDQLRQWKFRHEELLRRVLGTPQFSTRQAALAYIAPLLDENRTIFLQYGPTESNFSETRAKQWRRHVIRTVVPNNSLVERALKQNRPLLAPNERHVADLFSLHAQDFAARHLLNEWTAGSIRFPAGMDTLLVGEAQ